MFITFLFVVTAKTGIRGLYLDIFRAVYPDCVAVIIQSAPSVFADSDAEKAIASVMIERVYIFLSSIVALYITETSAY